MPLPRTSRAVRRLTVTLAALLVSATSVHAQRILGPTEDAVTLPRRTFRATIGGESSVQRDRWRDGWLEGLGAPLTGDSLNAARLSLLGPLDASLSALGVSGLASTLGSPRLDVRQRLFVTPVGLEYGLSDRITLGVRATLVRTRAEAQLRMRGDSGRANVGVNPISLGSGVAAVNGTAIGRYSAAATALIARRDACVANPGSSAQCPTILAELSRVATLASLTGQFATGLSQLYGTTSTAGRPYVPMAGSAIDSALKARSDSLATAMSRYGITSLTGATLPLGAQTPMTAAELAALVSDSTRGYGARALNDNSLTAIGDVHVGAKILVLDRIARGERGRFASEARGIRQSIGLDLRIGTGTPDDPDGLIDLGTGTGMHAVTVRSHTDLVWDERFWATVNLGVAQGIGSVTRDLRLPSLASQEFLEVWRSRPTVVRPGSALEAEVAPRWQVSDYIALTALWQWRRTTADQHALAAGAPVEDLLPGQLPMDAALLDARTATSSHRAALGATYSTLAARARGREGRAFEISYLHLQTIASGAGIVPKRFEDRIVLRFYPRFRAR
ncbi:MAG: hypothetical protein ACKORK_04955 [Gemmatimonadota bacterium]